MRENHERATAREGARCIRLVEPCGKRVAPGKREDMERLAHYIIRNFEVFSPCDFIARITQHIPDKSLPLLRYDGWYSSKMRSQRLKRAQPEAGAEVIEVSEPKARWISSKKWRELIKKVWETDPLLCPYCQNEMRIVALIDQADVIERIVRHLGLWDAGVRARPAPRKTGRLNPRARSCSIRPWE